MVQVAPDRLPYTAALGPAYARTPVCRSLRGRRTDRSSPAGPPPGRRGTARRRRHVPRWFATWQFPLKSRHLGKRITGVVASSIPGRRPSTNRLKFRADFRDRHPTALVILSGAKDLAV